MNILCFKRNKFGWTLKKILFLPKKLIHEYGDPQAKTILVKQKYGK